MTCYYPLTGYQGPDGALVFNKTDSIGNEMEVACGQCLGCRVDRSKTWAARCVHEAQMHQQNAFITLTYDNEHVPYGGTLVKEHFQKFMKRTRSRHEGKKIRFFHCGEYGTLGRPHYHACMFGLDYPDRVEHSVQNDITTYISDELTETWGKGFATCGELNYQTAAYTARYIMKKITGDKAKEHYERLVPDTGEIIQLEPEYVTMSLKPGIGYEWYQKYKTDVFPSDETPIPGKGVYPGVPKYYEHLLRKEDPDTYEKVKNRRRKHFRERQHEYTEERLLTKEKVKKAQLNQLRRNLE